MYPAGLFGDRPGPVPGWPEPSQPTLLPADYVAPPGPATASPSPGWEPRSLILSPAAKRLVGITLGIGAVLPVALLAMTFALFTLAMPTSPAPRAAAPAIARPPAPASTAPAPISTAPAPAPPGSDRWLRGLSSLSTDMENAMGPGDVVVTAASLRSAARQLRRCSAELAALGPPTAQLRPVYRLAARACGDFEHGAACFAAAARGYDAATVSPEATKFNRLLDCGDAGFNTGSYLISTAVANGSFIQAPG